MAKQITRRRAAKKKRSPRVIRKALRVLENVLDDIIDDPSRFIDKAERVAEHTARGIDQFVAEYERDPAKARRETRDFVVRNLAKLGKKRLRDAR